MTDYLDLVLARVRGGGGLRERPRTRYEPGGSAAGGAGDPPVVGEGGAGAGEPGMPGRPRGEVLGRVAAEERPARDGWGDGGAGDGVPPTGSGEGAGEPRRVRPSTTSLRSAAPGAVAARPALEAREPGRVGGAPAEERGRDAGREPATGPEPGGTHPGAGFAGALRATTDSGGRKALESVGQAVASRGGAGPAPVGEVPDGSGPLLRRSRPVAGAADPGSGGPPDAMVPRLRPAADPPRSREEHTPAPAAIQVRIGRVEVIAPRAPAAPPPVAAPAPRSPALSLDAYLRRRGGGRP